MRRRSAYVAVAVTYAVAVYVALALGGTRAESIEILLLVIAVSVAAGILAWRFATNMEVALRDTERSREELALVGRLSAGLSGPLTPTEVATQFLAAIKGRLPASVLASLLQYEETAESVRVLAQLGGSDASSTGEVYPVGAFPPVLRTRL